MGAYPDSPKTIVWKHTHKPEGEPLKEYDQEHIDHLNAIAATLGYSEQHGHEIDNLPPETRTIVNRLLPEVIEPYCFFPIIEAINKKIFRNNGGEYSGTPVFEALVSVCQTQFSRDFSHLLQTH